jgi:hypothetical protein
MYASRRAGVEFHVAQRVIGRDSTSEKIVLKAFLYAKLRCIGGTHVILYAYTY